MPRERMGHFYIDQTCIGCGACEHACPGKVDAIYKVPGDFIGRFAIEIDQCIDCGLCVPLCPVACIHDERTEGRLEGSGGYTRIKQLQAWAAPRAQGSHAQHTGTGGGPAVVQSQRTEETIP